MQKQIQDLVSQSPPQPVKPPAVKFDGAESDEINRSNSVRGEDFDADISIIRFSITSAAAGSLLPSTIPDHSDDGSDSNTKRRSSPLLSPHRLQDAPLSPPAASLERTVSSSWSPSRPSPVFSSRSPPALRPGPTSQRAVPQHAGGIAARAGGLMARNYKERN